MGASTLIRRTTSTAAVGTSFAGFVTDGSWDLTLAVTAGQVVEVGVSATWASGTVYGYMDAAVMVSGSAVRWVSSGTGTGLGAGIPGLFQSVYNDVVPAGGSGFYTVQSGDIVSGNITFRLYGKVSSGTRALFTGTTPVTFWASVCDNTPVSHGISGTSGNGSYAAFTGDVTIAAATGDVLAVTACGIMNGGGTVTSVDAATIVSSAATNWVSTGTSSHVGGVGAWKCANLDYEPFSGSVLYTVQSGDVVSGNVTFRMYGSSTSTTRTLDTASSFTVRKV